MVWLHVGCLQALEASGSEVQLQETEPPQGFEFGLLVQVPDPEQLQLMLVPLAQLTRALHDATASLPVTTTTTKRTSVNNIVLPILNMAYPSIPGTFRGVQGIGSLP